MVGLLWYSLSTCLVEGLFRTFNQIIAKCIKIIQLNVIIIIIVIVIIVKEYVYVI